MHTQLSQSGGQHYGRQLFHMRYDQNEHVQSSRSAGVCVQTSQPEQKLPQRRTDHGQESGRQTNERLFGERFIRCERFEQAQVDAQLDANSNAIRRAF